MILYLSFKGQNNFGLRAVIYDRSSKNSSIRLNNIHRCDAKGRTIQVDLTGKKQFRRNKGKSQ